MIKGVPYDAEIEYLEGTGTQWIDTNIVASASCDQVVSAAFLQNYTDPSKSLVGAGRDGNTPSSRICTQYGEWTWWNGGNFYRSNVPIVAGEYHECKFGVSGLYIDDVRKTTARPAGLPDKSSILFGYNSLNSGTATGLVKARIRYYKAIDNGVLLRDFIPVRKGTVGYMYDRVTRKLFGNQGTGDFVRGPDKAYPVMSIHRYPSPSGGTALGKMGAGQRMMRSFSAKDYVQDGLVAMWDGIENAGWGVHDPNATTWKDLIGNYDLTFNGFRQIGGDYIYFGDDITKTSNASCDFTPMYDSVKNGYTAEIVVRLSGGRTMSDVALATSSAAYIGLFSRRYGPSALEISYVYYALYGQYRGDFGVIYDSSQIIKEMNRGGFSLSCSRGQNAQSYYLNGSERRNTTDAILPVGALQGSTRYDTLIIGAGGGQVGFCYNTPYMELLDLRLYGKILTAAEIAHNYRIDKIRFNLP